MINDISYLSFELSTSCNMAKIHPWCPINDPLRYPRHEGYTPCPDHILIGFAARMYSRGFSGMVAFHFYSDPLMDIPRLLRVIQGIKRAEPKSKFNLWTNGAFLDESSKNWLHVFSQIVVTIHDSNDRSRLEKLLEDMNTVSYHDAEYDNRKNLYDEKNIVKGGCLRPFKIEMPVNYYGNVRMCCSDFRGKVHIGNIQRDDFDVIIDNFNELSERVRQGIIPICWKCRALFPNSVVL